MKLSMTFIAPRIGAGKKKNSYACTNTIPDWYRWYKPKISLKFKTMLKEWFLNQSDEQFHRAEVTFQIMRENKRKMDPDAFGASANKWAIDALVEQGYLVDDDKVRIILEPTVLGCSEITETSIKMTAEFYDPVVK